MGSFAALLAAQPSSSPGSRTASWARALSAPDVRAPPPALFFSAARRPVCPVGRGRSLQLVAARLIVPVDGAFSSARRVVGYARNFVRPGVSARARENAVRASPRLLGERASGNRGSGVACAAALRQRRRR